MSRGPQFPLYIPSKGRAGYMMTSKVLTEMGVPHYVIVELQEAEEYRAAIKGMGLLADVINLDIGFKEKYELCDALGQTRSTGPGPARNFAWQHSVESGHKWHWVMDDNIRAFYRMTGGIRVKCNSAAFWLAMEDFVLRYRNVSMAGPNYSMFGFGASALPPFIKNTRIYSCNLIRNDLRFRWRGRYNEDTILSLDMLKAGWCTIQFNAFLQGKTQTQAMGGGNTKEFYHAEGGARPPGGYAPGGTDAKSEMLRRVHPDVTKVVRKFGRTHHEISYRKLFGRNRLILNREAAAPSGVDNYGMELKRKGKTNVT